MELDHVRVVLVNTRFPENVGMAVRACANMGCDDLRLVTPERWNVEKAAPLATPKGQSLLGRVRLEEDLLEALGDTHVTIATTARTGGWRKSLMTPWEVGEVVAKARADGRRVALVFGSEDRGLENRHIELCQHIMTIPTSGEASSLNLAQAVLLTLYECHKAVRAHLGSLPKGAHREGERAGEGTDSEVAHKGTTYITAADEERLMRSWEDALLRLDVLHGDNPSYFLMPWRRFFARANLRKHEYEAFMGLCRQIRARTRTGKE